MRKRLNVLTILLLILSTNVAHGNKTKLTKSNHNSGVKGKSTDYIKRSVIHKNDDQHFSVNRQKRQIPNKDLTKSDIDLEINRKFIIPENKLNKDPPFWGNRGRRSSEELYNDSPYADIFNVNNDYDNVKVSPKLNDYPNLKDRREDTVPFWGNRGRRNSDEIPEENEMDGPFWSSRGRRQEDEPFWGNRGRRESKLPIWGNQGNIEEEPFWGNRGRRQDNEPFWGNRGRRQDDDPFWGNRGKKEDEPFWGNRGKKSNDDSEPFWGNRGRRKEDLKESIMEAINKVEYDIGYLSRLKKGSDMAPNGHFWINRGRDSQLKHLFGGSRIKSQLMARPFKNDYELNAKPSVSSTVMDDRIFANEPHYIIVERSGRSSAEIDPFFISRGKKKNLFKTTRGRRGAIEEIVKSVRNDPFYIARGKKDTRQDTSENSAANLASHEELLKAKELICATLELMLMKNESKNIKREINENDRDRRNILKKLAAQLQNDPYFVSRGKKNEVKENDIEEFVSHVATLCH